MTLVLPVRNVQTGFWNKDGLLGSLETNACVVSASSLCDVHGARFPLTTTPGSTFTCLFLVFPQPRHDMKLTTESARMRVPHRWTVSFHLYNSPKSSAVSPHFTEEKMRLLQLKSLAKVQGGPGIPCSKTHALKHVLSSVFFFF